jgi:hypothetical protein
MNSNVPFQLSAQLPIGQIQPPPFGFTSLDQAINTLLPVIFIVAALAAFFYMLYAGLRFITSGGSDEGTKAARMIFRNVIIGLLLLGLASVLFRFISALIPGMSAYFS